MKKYNLPLIILFSFFMANLHGQCENYTKDQSIKVTNYEMDVYYNDIDKKANCQQKLVWNNFSKDTINELRFYMYMNAFSHRNTTFLKDEDSKIFGQDLETRKKEEWGYIYISNAVDETGTSLSNNMYYDQPDDGNELDSTVLVIPLKKPLLPGESANIEIDFTVKLPRTIVRAGYGKNGYALFVHWFPQPGVYEIDDQGHGSWNCHQFFRSTEFYADFGDYEVSINLPKNYIIGATGCKINEKITSDRQKVTYHAHDVIDFGFVVYPHFDKYTYTHNQTEIEILMPSEHCAFAERYLDAIEKALDFMGDYLGKYPYPKITVIDPPVHTLNSGFMEYPMMITGASFYGIPKSIRTVESLVTHEFLHMYFMGVLASNEKEEPWLDEGFVTYFEDKIMDHYYGEKHSIINLLGYHSGSAENTRIEYTTMDDPSVDAIATPGYEIQGPYKPIIYSKTATMLKTLENIVGEKVMQNTLREFFEEYKFKHPKEKDFRKICDKVLRESDLDLAITIDGFLQDALHTKKTIDFWVEEIEYRNNIAVVRCHKGSNFKVPVTIRVAFASGLIKNYEWNNNLEMFEIIVGVKDPIESIIIDPKFQIQLDLNFINNSYIINQDATKEKAASMKVATFTQSLFEFLTFLF